MFAETLLSILKVISEISVSVLVFSSPIVWVVAAKIRKSQVRGIFGAASVKIE
jgi:hypothetical protein